MNLNKHTSAHAHILTLDNGKRAPSKVVKSRQKSRTSYIKNVINSDDIRSNEDDDEYVLF